MAVKTSAPGHFTIPTAPAAGTSCTSGAANAFTASYVQLISSTAAALYITGVHLESAAALAATYIVIQLASGGAGSETVIGQYLVPLTTGSTSALGFRPIYPPIPVANATRIACKTADSVGSKATLVTLECIAQSNVVDDGIAVGTVTTVTNQLTAAQIATGVWQDAVSGDFTTASSIGKSLYTTGAVPGAAGGFQIAGSNAATTYASITVSGATTLTGNVALADGLTIAAPSTGNRAGLSVAGNGTGAGLLVTGGATGIGLSVVGGATSGDGVKVTTTSGHGVNLAPAGASKHGLFATGGNSGTSDGASFAAGTGGVDFRANRTGNLTGNVSGSVGSVSGAVGSVTGLTASNLDVAVSTRLASASYTAPSNLTAAQIATGVWTDTTAGDFTTALSIGKSVMNGVALGTGLTINAYTGNTAQTGDSFARLGAPAGASVSADVAAVKVDTAAVKLKTDNLPASPAAVGSAMTLTSGERTSIANEVEAQIIDDTDSEKVLTAITDKIASVNPSLGGLTLAAIGSQVRTELTTELGRIDAAISSRSTFAGGAVASVTDPVTVGTNNDKTGYALSGAGVTSIWAEVMESGVTAVQMMRGFGAVLMGKASGQETLTAVFRDLGDTKDRVTATVDSNGNRSSVTRNLS